MYICGSSTTWKKIRFKEAARESFRWVHIALRGLFQHYQHRWYNATKINYGKAEDTKCSQTHSTSNNNKHNPLKIPDVAAVTQNEHLKNKIRTQINLVRITECPPKSLSLVIQQKYAFHYDHRTWENTVIFCSYKIPLSKTVLCVPFAGLFPSYSESYHPAAKGKGERKEKTRKPKNKINTCWAFCKNVWWVCDRFHIHEVLCMEVQGFPHPVYQFSNFELPTFD